MNNFLLAPYRILDLTDEKGFFCGKILGDLGADVIKIEKPGGDPSRARGPFYHDIPHPEKSLFWFAFNNNKRGITLNIETDDGRQIFRRLVKTADFVIESFPAGYLDNLGLGYQSLSSINPRLVMISITPFGQAGPYRDFKGPDIVVWALGGPMYITGDPDRPPLQVSFPQAYLNASISAVMGSLLALHWRESTGEGQHVDLSAQESAVWTSFCCAMDWTWEHLLVERAGEYGGGGSVTTKGSGRPLLQTWPCKDGYVSYIIMGGLTGLATNKALVEWMDREGMCPDYLRVFDWSTFDVRNSTPQDFTRLEEPIINFFKTHTKAELTEGSMQRNIWLLPVWDPKEVFENPQPRARNYWVDLPHPELGRNITYPGPFVKADECPCLLRCRAPLMGEHNAEIYKGELGFTDENLIMFKQAGVI